jgi:outer membrane protein assembly factor BamE (lipoprotein component of BamABCDE complex)
MKYGALVTAIGLCMGLAFFVGGCASSSLGNQNLTQDKVNQIKKGATTKDEIISLLGQPDQVSLMGDGRRMMLYSGAQTNVNGTSTVLIGSVPLVGAFAPRQTTETTHRQTLEVILDSSDIVQDYQYSQNANETDTSMGGLSTNVQQKQLPIDSPNGAATAP